MARKNTLSRFSPEQATTLMQACDLYARCSERHTLHPRWNEICDLKRYSIRDARLGKRLPNETELLFPVYGYIRELDETKISYLELRALVTDVKSWNEIDSAARPVRRTNSSRRRASQKNERSQSLLFSYFSKALRISREQCDQISHQMEGFYFGYRLKSNGSVLKSLFYIPERGGRLMRSLRLDRVIPTFEHWLQDASGAGRHARGHILPLEGEVVMLGFVENNNVQGSYVGVKIITLRSQPGREHIDSVTGVFLAKDLNAGYEAGRGVLFRLPQSEVAQVQGAVDRWLIASRRPRASVHQLIRDHLGDYVTEISVETAASEMGIAVAAFLGGVNIKATVPDRSSDIVINGPVHLDR